MFQWVWHWLQWLFDIFQISEIEFSDFRIRTFRPQNCQVSDFRILKSEKPEFCFQNSRIQQFRLQNSGNIEFRDPNAPSRAKKGHSSTNRPARHTVRPALSPQSRPTATSTVPARTGATLTGPGHTKGVQVGAPRGSARGSARSAPAGSLPFLD